VLDEMIDLMLLTNIIAHTPCFFSYVLVILTADLCMDYLHQYTRWTSCQLPVHPALWHDLWAVQGYGWVVSAVEARRVSVLLVQQLLVHLDRG